MVLEIVDLVEIVVVVGEVPAPSEARIVLGSRPPEAVVALIAEAPAVAVAAGKTSPAVAVGAVPLRIITRTGRGATEQKKGCGKENAEKSENGRILNLLTKRSFTEKIA